MEVGMLWFDSSEGRDLESKLDRAVQHYRTKHNTHPTTCYVNPFMLPGGERQIAGVQVRGSNTVLPHHFWLGVEDEVRQRPAA